MASKENLQNILDKKFGQGHYDLSESVINGWYKPFKLKCSIHGEFETTVAKINYKTTHICEKCAKRTEFLKEMRKLYGDRYNFSLYGLDGNYDEGNVICKKHGSFHVTYDSLKQKAECPLCVQESMLDELFGLNGMKNRTYEETLSEMKERLGEERFNNFEFDPSTYHGFHRKIRAYCKKHDEWFEQTPERIAEGRGCDACSYEHKYGSLKHYKKTFEECAREVHGDQYDYLGFDEETGEYIMYCHVKDENGKEHGIFKQTRGHHLDGQGCPVCRYIKSAAHKRKSLETLKKDIAEIIPDRNYDYDFDSYVAYNQEMRIYCHNRDKDGNEHGWFTMEPRRLLNRYHPQGCQKCGREATANAKRVTPEQFIERATALHRGKYKYKAEDYKGYFEDMQMLCPIHGYFSQTPANHLQGQGCPFCKESKLEIEIRNFLDDNKIEYIAQYRVYWLGKMSLDFYLPKYFAAIECQGKQHFNIGGWSEPFDVIKDRDQKKAELCKLHNVSLFYFSNLGIEYPYDVYEDKAKLLEEITKQAPADI